MKLAIWDAPMAEAAASGLTQAGDHQAGDHQAGDQNAQVRRLRPEACAAALLKQQVDVALVPTTMVLQGAEGFDVIPDVAVSSWKYPFARVVLKEGLESRELTLACDRRAVQEQFVATVALREHYQLGAEAVPYDAPDDPLDLLRGDENAALLTSTALGALPDLGRLGGGGLVMDLGQEWFELAKYPMVWGLFVTREDTLGADTTAALRDRLHAAEERRPDWVEQAEHPLLEEFFAEDLRLRFDDLAVASLTELKHYLFYDDVIGHVPDLSFAPLPEAEEEERGEEQWVRGET
jgi:predicted solute-binding protein